MTTKAPNSTVSTLFVFETNINPEKRVKIEPKMIKA